MTAPGETAPGQAGPVLLERQGGVAHLRFNRPEVLNAIDPEMAEAMIAAVDRLVGDASLRCVVLSGNGRGFMAGGDVALFHRAGAAAPEVVGRMIHPLHAAIEKLAALPCPVVASIQGPAVGAGFSMALAADVAIAADDAVFALGYLRIGATPDCSATWNLPRIVGLRRALGMALLDETLDAQAALAAGIVNRVVPAAELAEATAKLAQRLAAGPTVAIGRTKALLRASSGRPLAEQLAAEAESFLATAGSADFAEGTAAFVQRRRPVFTGS